MPAKPQADGESGSRRDASQQASSHELATAHYTLCTGFVQASCDATVEGLGRSKPLRASASTRALVGLELVVGYVLLRPLQRVGQKLGHAVVELRGIPRHLEHVGLQLVVEGDKGIEYLLAAVRLGQGFMNIQDVEKEVERMHHLFEHLQVAVNLGHAVRPAIDEDCSNQERWWEGSLPAHFRDVGVLSYCVKQASEVTAFTMPRLIEVLKEVGDFLWIICEVSDPKRHFVEDNEGKFVSLVYFVLVMYKQLNHPLDHEQGGLL